MVVRVGFLEKVKQRQECKEVSCVNDPGNTVASGEQPVQRSREFGEQQGGQCGQITGNDRDREVRAKGGSDHMWVRTLAFILNKMGIHYRILRREGM